MLPTPEEWVLAARGPTVRAYAWGQAPPDCAHASAENCQPELAVEHHSAGASPSGVQDVLLTPRELLRGGDKSLQQGCTTGSFCVAGSLAGVGEIHGVWPVQDEGDGGVEPTQPIFGFRCAWEAQ
jgi:hypothetical protein